MATKIVGKINWEDADLGGSTYMKLEEGTNTVRIISSPSQYYQHWTQDVSNAKANVRCALAGCPLCLKGEKASARWMVAVINRATEKCATVELGSQAFRQILSLKSSAKWGDPRKYDIDIIRQPKGTNPLYVVQANPPTPMTDDEKKMAQEFLKETDLQEMTAAPTPEEVNEKLGFETKKASPKKAAAAVSNDFGGDDSGSASDSTSTDNDFNFDDT